MKTLVTILAIALVSVGVFAQSPQTMSYQAVVRNSSNELVASTIIGIQISILQKSSTGDPVFVERHSTTTNANGLATIEIGGGTPVSGRFETIDWSSGPFFLKTETDPTGGSSYSISGTSKLLSVPYALYAEKSGKSGSVDPWLTEGNASTTVGQNFLGTTDLQPLMFKVNSVKSGYIDWDYNTANTGFGYLTLSSNTTGHSNTANGYEALQANTTGVQNSAIGKLALSANTGGNNNIALGSEALSHNTTGSFNVAAGTSTMRFNTLGNYNTANGIWALYNNTEGSYNSAYGTSALQGNITGNNNTAIGYNANVVSGNLSNATAIGNGAIATASNEVRIGNAKVSSLYFGTANNLAVTTDSVPNMFYDKTTGQIMRSTAIATGSSSTQWDLSGNAGTSVGLNFLGTTDLQALMFKVNSVQSGYIDYDKTKANTFLGFQTGLNNTGFSNTAVGYGAFVINVEGHQNTALGYRSLYSNTTGNANAANGMSSLFSNTTGSFNTATGVNALFANTTGLYNTANGNMSLANTGASDGNTALGYSSGDNNVNNGNNNTFIGNSAAANVSGVDNATALGYQALVAGSNTMILGNNDVNVGIGLSGLIPGNKLEINAAPATNASGLRFRQLTSSSTQTPNPGRGVLSVNTDGDVILVPDATGAGGGGSSTHSIGDVYGGGTVFYVCDNGQHGLIAASSDQSLVQWNNTVSRLTGTTGDGLFAGAMNTTMIVATQIGDNQAGNFAAKVCADYSVIVGGVTYGDWYLPSLYELNLLYLAPTVVSAINIATNVKYWSSTEFDAPSGWMENLTSGLQSYGAKSVGYHIRAIRAF